MFSITFSSLHFRRNLQQYCTVVLRLLSFGNFIVKLLFFIARDQKGAGVTKTRYSNIPLSDGREIICEKYTYSILVHIRHASVLSPGPYVLQNAVRVVNNTRGKMKMSGSERKPPAKTLRRIKVIDSVTTSRSSPVPKLPKI